MTDTQGKKICLTTMMGGDIIKGFHQQLTHIGDLDINQLLNTGNVPHLLFIMT